MRLTFSFLLLICLFFNTPVSGQNQPNSMDTLSYSIGLRIASDMKRQGFKDLDGASLAKAIDDVFKGNQLAVSEADANKEIQQFFEAKQKAQEAERMKQYESVKLEGEAFLQENKGRPEVVTLESGLQYEELQAGTGESPKASDNVTVHYKGTLLDGTVFDSSYKRGKPANFGVSQVIKGWTEALQLMKPGAKWKLYIPYDLAYGGGGAGQQIQPYSMLIFEVELISIN